MSNVFDIWLSYSNIYIYMYMVIDYPFQTLRIHICPSYYLATTGADTLLGHVLVHFHMCATYFRCLMNREASPPPPSAVIVTHQSTDDESLN